MKSQRKSKHFFRKGQEENKNSKKEQG